MSLRAKRMAQSLGKRLSYGALYLLIAAFLFSMYAEYSGYISSMYLNFLLTSILSLMFPAFAFSYMFYKGHSGSEIIKIFGLGKEGLTVTNIGFGILLFVILFSMEIAVTLLSASSGVQINTNVQKLLQYAPAWFYIFTAVIAPIDEEIFFRGFLITRLSSFIGSVNYAIVVSAVFFGVLHAGYDSSFGIEIIAALIFGLLAGYVFTRLKSLYPSIIAHIVLNSFALLVALVLI